MFLIQYLRSIGFKADNDLFAGHSWYFRNALVRANYKNAHRNALVRANYKNAQKGIDYAPSTWNTSSATCYWARNGIYAAMSSTSKVSADAKRPCALLYSAHRKLRKD